MWKQLPKEIIEAINLEVGRNELDYADNYRAYRHKDNHLYQEYMDCLNHGCCGYFDVECVDLNGDTWTIGCNYGH